MSNTSSAPSGRKSPGQQAGFLVIGQNIASLAEALVMLAVVRLLGKVEVGVLGALILAYQTVGLIAAAGFPSALMYFLPARPAHERRAIAWQFARALVSLGVGAGLVLVALAALDGHWPGLFGRGVVPAAEVGSGGEVSFRYLYLMALYPLADLPTRMLNNLLVVERRARAVAGISIIKAVGQSLATILPIALGANLWVVVGCMTAWGYVYATFLLYFLRDLYGRAPRVPSPITTRAMFAFALPIGVTTVVSLVNSRLDHYLIMLSFPAARFAEYQAGAWQIPVITSLVYPIGAAFMPRWRELFAEGKNRKAIDVWRDTALRVSNVVVPVSCIFIVAAEETMEVLFTPAYVAGAGVFRWYSIWTMGRVATFGNVITAAGRPRLILRAALVAVGSNALISVLLLWWVGFEGPAMGTAIAFVPEVLIYCWFVSTSSGVPFTRTFPLLGYGRRVVVGLGLGAVAFAAKGMLPWPAAARLGAVAILILGGYAALGTATGLITRTDWEYIGRWLKRHKVNAE